MPQSIPCLFGLPPEIRNYIWEVAFATLTSPESNIIIAHWKGPCINDGRQPPIVQVNRQARSETLPIHYGSKRFVVACHKYGNWEEVELATRWLTVIGQHAINLRHVLVEMTHGFQLQEHPVTLEGVAHFEINLGNYSKQISVTAPQVTGINDYGPEYRRVNDLTLSKFQKWHEEIARDLQGMMDIMLEKKDERRLRGDEWILLLKMLRSMVDAKARFGWQGRYEDGDHRGW